MKSLKLAAIIFICLMLNNQTEAQNRFFNLKQPDGTTFSAKEMGACWLTWYETPEGYMVQKGKDRYYHYVTINKNGDFVPLPQKAGKDQTGSVPVRPYENPVIRAALVEKIQAYNKAADKNRARFLRKQREALGLAGGKQNSLNKLALADPFTIEIGVILVEFSDLTHYTGGNRPDGYLADDFVTMLFSNDEYISPVTDSPDDEEVFGSMCDYYEFQSHGILAVIGHVVNAENPDGTPSWIDLGNTIGSYQTFGGPSIHYDVYIDAINAAIDSSWDVEQDMHIVILAGSPDDASYHQWGGSGTHQGFFSESDFDPSFHNHFNNNWFGAAGYFERKSGTFSHIGIFVHEAFHVMGWGIPNIIGQGSTNSSHSDSGDWSSMGTGYRTGPVRKSASPGDLDAVARVMMEWADPTDVDNVSGNLMNEQIEYIEEDSDTNETLDFYRLDDPYSGAEIHR